MPPETAPAAAPAAALAADDDPLTVSVLTFGPGDHPFFKFGHNAIWIRDRAAGTDRVYNFGTFKFDSAWLIPEFLRGRLTYWLSVSSLKGTMNVYQRENRSIAAQELALPADEKRALQARLERNALPQNRAYKYDYFLDNCSTRVRDAVDRATGGRLHAASTVPGRLTLRDQALRLTADHLPLYVALDLVLSGTTDRPIDRWAEMFIPEELARGLRTVTVPGEAAARPLVSSEQVLFEARRPPPLQVPPARAVSFLLCGLSVALVFIAFGWAAPGRPIVRVLLGVLVALFGLVVGFVGWTLSLLWLFTDHVVAHRNENILQCAPWAIALVVLGFGVAAGMSGAIRKARALAVAGLLLALVGWGLKVLPAFGQHNANLIAFCIPAWLGLAIGLSHVRHDPSTLAGSL
jgi:hypothetical protein